MIGFPDVIKSLSSQLVPCLCLLLLSSVNVNLRAKLMVKEKRKSSK